MNSIYLLFTIKLIFLISGCSKENSVTTPDTSNQEGGLVGMSLIFHENSPVGFSGFLESVDLMVSKGINLFGMAPEWQELEPSPNLYSFQDPILNPLTVLDPDKIKFESFILVLKVIDTNRKTLPADIALNSFDDTLVINRFFSLIDTLSALEPVKRISHMLIGNEVDGYLSMNPTELNSFNSFYQQSINRIHQKMPWVKVGTIITFNSLVSHPNIFNTLTPNSDFICYTYYSTDETNPNWQMRSPNETKADIDFMANKANNMPFAFTEIGYPSSAANNSSELKQKQFVEEMFDALKPYKNQGEVEFLFYHGLYDYPTGFCSQYAQQQGIDSTYLCGFMNNLGLNSYETGQPKQAWDTFVNKLKSW